MNFLKNISIEASFKDSQRNNTKLDLLSFVDQQTLDHWNTIRPNIKKLADVDISILNDVILDKLSNEVNNRLSTGVLIEVRCGIMLPYHKNRFILPDARSLYFCAINNMNWGHVVFVNDFNIHSKHAGDVFSFSSDTIEIGAANSGWESLKFLIAW
jgi:hypothetical protein